MTLAGRYLLQALIEQTSLGTLWLATDTVLDRRVSVTLIDARVGANPPAREKLFADARALATSPGTRLVRLLDAGIEGGVPFLVRERIAGQTLSEVIEGRARLEPERAAAIVAGALDAVGEAHAEGVLHLDLSPSNVLLEEDGGIRVRQAGIRAAVVAAGLAEPGGSNGHAAWGDAGAGGQAGGEHPLAPEAPALDERSDVWSAGALLSHLLSGRRLVTGEVPETRAGVPKPIRAVLERALQPDPAARFQSAESMALALRSAGGGSSPRARDRHPAGRRGVFRTWLAVPLLVVLVAITVAGAGLRLGGLELGGPVGIRLLEESPSPPPPAAAPIDVASVIALDPPPGDGHENDDALDYATDGDPATVWRSENYFDGRLNKPGVGLLLDLGATWTVTGFRLQTPSPGFTFALVVGDDPGALLRRAEVAPTYVAPQSEQGLDPGSGRYALLWIESVVPTSDGNRAEVSDIRLFGTP
jgi:hypothetical protein